MKFEMSFQEKILILGVVLITLVSGLTYSFAYFVSGVDIKGTGAEMSGKTAKLTDVTFKGGAQINVTNIVPGDTSEKDFTVTIKPGQNSKETEVTYEVFLNVSSNTFTKCTGNEQTEETGQGCDSTKNDELTYSLYEGETKLNTKNNNLLDAKDSSKISLGTITKKITETEQTFNYQFKIEWQDTGKNQNHNKNKTFTGSISVEFALPEE